MEAEGFPKRRAVFKNHKIKDGGFVSFTQSGRVNFSVVFSSWYINLTSKALSLEQCVF
jgi:hypothetical protein